MALLVGWLGATLLSNSMALGHNPAPLVTGFFVGMSIHLSFWLVGNDPSPYASSEVVDLEGSRPFVKFELVIQQQLGFSFW